MRNCLGPGCRRILAALALLSNPSQGRRQLLKDENLIHNIKLLAWKIFFSTAWNDFETRFSNILENIQRHQNLIDYEARAEDIIESQKAREIAQKQLEEATRERKTKRKKDCADWLSPADVDTTKEKASQAKTPGTSEWLLASGELTAWLDGDPNSNTIIWLNGIPGAGMYTYI